jgi:hypothetical protein
LPAYPPSHFKKRFMPCHLSVSTEFEERKLRDPIHAWRNCRCTIPIEVGVNSRFPVNGQADRCPRWAADFGIGATREVELLAILAVLDAPTHVADLTDVKVAGSASYHDVDETNVVMPSNDRLALRRHVPHSDGFSGSMISKL